jgi:hypothetical protein
MIQLGKKQWHINAREATISLTCQPDSEKSLSRFVKNVRYLMKCVNETKRASFWQPARKIVLSW